MHKSGIVLFQICARLKSPIAYFAPNSLGNPWIHEDDCHRTDFYYERWKIWDAKFRRFCFLKIEGEHLLRANWPVQTANGLHCHTAHANWPLQTAIVTDRTICNAIQSVRRCASPINKKLDENLCVSLGNVSDVSELMVESWRSSHTSIWPASVLWQDLWMQWKCDSTISFNTSKTSPLHSVCIAFRVHYRPIKLILGSKEAEETNLLDFYSKSRTRRRGRFGGGGGVSRTWCLPLGEAKQPGDGEDTGRPGMENLSRPQVCPANEHQVTRCYT